MVRNCPECGAQVLPTSVKARTHPKMPEFTTVIWACGSCGWSSQPDGFGGGLGVGEPATVQLNRDPVELEDPPDDALAALSEHELEVVRFIAAGLSNREIADRLVVSVNTVKGPVRSAYRKMQVTSRTRAQLWAIRHGLFEPGDKS